MASAGSINESVKSAIGVIENDGGIGKIMKAKIMAAAWRWAQRRLAMASE
jgi:hypothetical protein